MKRYIVGFLVLVVLMLSINVEVAAADEDLPKTGWEITKYICDFEGCHTDPDGDPNFWPIHMRLGVDGWAVKVRCLDLLTPLPPLGTKCTRDGNKFTCDSPPGTQDDFELVEIIEEPPPPPEPTDTPTITPTPTATPTATPTPTNTPTPTPTNTPTNTPVPPTNTPRPPTKTPKPPTETPPPGNGAVNPSLNITLKEMVEVKPTSNSEEKTFPIFGLLVLLGARRVTLVIASRFRRK